MIYKELGRTGERLPAIGLGTWKMPVDSRGALAALREGFKLGARFVDTAELYANEELVGRAIAGMEDIFVATKVSPNHFHYDDVIRACEASIKRLGVKSIDLYQLHWPNHSIPISETMRAMEHLADSGRIRHIGVSNFSVDEMVEAQGSMRRYEIVSNQVEYSPLARSVEDGIAEFCVREHLTLIAYSPLARGHVFDERSKANGVIKDIAARHNRSVAQVVLNYIVSKGGCVAIPKAGSIRHVEENVGSTDFKLSKRDIESIDSISGYTRRPLAGKTLQAFLKSTGAWAGILERIERGRRSGQ